MTTTDDRLETRLRRDLAELAAIPATRDRVRTQVARRPRPGVALVLALVVVLALVATSLAIVGTSDHASTNPTVSTGPHPTTPVSLPPDPFVATMAAGWQRLLPPSTAGNFVDGLSMIASGARGTIVMGTETGCGDAEGFWSPDGAAWHVVSNPPVIGRAEGKCSVTSGIAATESGFVAVGNTGRSGNTSAGITTGVVWTSSTGDSWQLATNGTTFRSQVLASVATDGNMIVIGGARDVPTVGNHQAAIWYSTDGARWTKVALGERGEVAHVVHGPHGWLAIGGGLMWRSDDGRHWTSVDATNRAQLVEVAAGPAGFIAHGYRNTSEVFFTSPDGRRWNRRADIPTGGVLGPIVQSVAFLGGHFLALGQAITNVPDPGPALWVLDGDAWAAVALPAATFSEPATGDQTSQVVAPTFAIGVALPDGTLLVAGGGRPVTQIAKPSYGPRIWRWKPAG